MAHGVIHLWTIEQYHIVLVVPDVVQVPCKTTGDSQLYAAHGITNERNNFYQRFYTVDFSVDQVAKVFKHTCAGKATSLDGTSALLLKTCAEELAPA